MIHYNMRYRGPYEKEKFILNIFQYSNLINSLSHDSAHTDTWKTLNDMTLHVDKVFDDIVGQDGIADKIYKNFIMMRGK